MATAWQQHDNGLASTMQHHGSGTEGASNDKTTWHRHGSTMATVCGRGMAMERQQIPRCHSTTTGHLGAPTAKVVWKCSSACRRGVPQRAGANLPNMTWRLQDAAITLHGQALRRSGRRCGPARTDSARRLAADLLMLPFLPTLLFRPSDWARPVTSTRDDGGAQTTWQARQSSTASGGKAKAASKPQLDRFPASFGRCLPTLVEIDEKSRPTWSRLGQCLLISGHNWPSSRQIWPHTEPIWSKFAEFG